MLPLPLDAVDYRLAIYHQTSWAASFNDYVYVQRSTGRCGARGERTEC